MTKFILVFLLFLFVSCSEQQQSNETFETDQGLSLDHRNEFKKELIEVTEDIYVGVGYGLANSIMIETENNMLESMDTMIATERNVELMVEQLSLKIENMERMIVTEKSVKPLAGALSAKIDNIAKMLVSEERRSEGVLAQRRLEKIAACLHSVA